MSSSSSEETFEDCVEGGATFYECSDNSSGRASSCGSSSTSTNGGPLANGRENGKTTTPGDMTSSVWGGRCRLPSTMISRNNFSVWSFLKKCIGKELSKITMPLVFNEPLSFLQRMVEYLEYSSLLLQAVACDSAIRRHELVTAFAVSATASNWERLGKPFNPMLGETYELDREDLGFRIVCEQVSHHPPVSAFHAESPHFTFQGCVHPKIKFWGSSIQVIPKGLVTLHLHRHNEVYTWQNINCSVHNVIIGKIWIEHYGEMEVINHATKFKSLIQFKPSGWTGSDPHKMHGYLYDKEKRKVKAFYGKWIEAFYSVDVSVYDEHMVSSGVNTTKQRPQSTPEYQQSEDIPEVGESCNLNLPGQTKLWSATPKPRDTSKFYNFTHFAMMLNELDETSSSSIAPTDSRFRPDMRLMEAGDGDGASLEKSRVEDKQREERKQMKKRKEEFTPRWFRLQENRFTAVEEWQSTGEYWNRSWDRCPDIY